MAVARSWTGGVNSVAEIEHAEGRVDQQRHDAEQREQAARGDARAIEVAPVVDQRDGEHGRVDEHGMTAVTADDADRGGRDQQHDRQHPRDACAQHDADGHRREAGRDDDLRQHDEARVVDEAQRVGEPRMMDAELRMCDDGAQHHQCIEREKESEIPVQADRREQAPQAGSDVLHAFARASRACPTNQALP